MALNPFFLQGTSSEQRLVQDLINEQLRTFGVEVTYIPRKFVNVKSIIQEVQASKFDDNFAIEAYINNYDGYGGTGDVLTKFGMSLRDEVTLTISRERFEDFISPFMSADDYLLSSRPREGDLIFFPLGQRLFEVKFVEHENPFYQLGKNYVYELKCELFEYEDEVIDTSIDIIDTQVQDEGVISTLKLVGVGRTTTVMATIGVGYVREIFLNNDGYGFTSQPTITFTESPTGDTARAVGILTTKANVTSIEKILMTSAGAGYNSTPTITISGGGGSGAAATCSVETVYNGVIRFNVTDGGVGYGTEPNITVGQPGAGTTAVGIASIGYVGSDTVVRSIYVQDPGRGYSTLPDVTVDPPSSMGGIGTFFFNEEIEGVNSYALGRVKSWDADTDVLKLSNVGIGSTVFGFYVGEEIVGKTSGARYTVASYDATDVDDKYNSGDEFQTFGDDILDFTESNPFGQV